MKRVEDKVAVVTGAGTGIGEACARLLAREGARVVLTDVDEEALARVAKDIGGHAIGRRQDVAKEGEWEDLMAFCLDRHGRLDILVNNAGVGVAANVEDTRLEDWRFVMSVNLDGVFLGVKHAIGAMKKSGGGSIVNMASIEAMIGDRRLAAYDASKGGVWSLTRSAALHCARAGLGIRVNSVHPGFIRTRMVRGFVKNQPDPEAAERELVHLHPIGHLGEPDDVAYGVLYLASDESKFVTGSSLVIDGGYTAR